jgi:catechol 2,3-dioxygenase-like lactoylglutathione lyase family enzyme
MPIKGIDHWVMVVNDLDKTPPSTAPRVRDRVGGPAQQPAADADHRIGGSQKINVHAREWPDRPGYLGARRPSAGGADFCLEWDGTVQEVLDLLAKNGITPEAGPGPRSCARGTSTSVYFRDPDDNLVEFTVY